ncbi:MAG TPA: serine hydrolase domain-containing protein [Gammaproteobacteria bacterium]|nr:serine hydrolase domain-containing protein [Gammaproteobacteria bacterium]
MKLATAAVGAALTFVSFARVEAATNPEAVGLARERLERIDAMIERRIAAGDLTGAVAIVARRGQVAHVAIHGTMDSDTRLPMRADTLFRIASMTKPIVGVGIMMMVEENKLRLTDPVARYIPEFANLRVAVARPEGGSAAAPAFDLAAPQRQVTIKDLLSHVSGLGSGPMSNSTIDAVARREGETLADYIPRLGGTALEFQPGTRWAYSPGAGFETLGRVLEIASGMPLDEFFATRIFAPLGMRDITFWPSDSQWPRVATVYRREESGLVKQTMPNDSFSRNVYFRGSGGLYSTAESYVPFGMMLANGGELNGKRLLSRKSVEMLGAVHVPDTLPGRPAGEGFGLSVRVVTDHAARGTLLSDGTYGWSGAQGTHFFVDPKEELVGVLMIQTPNITEIRADFENLVAQAIVDDPWKSPKGD